MKTANHPAGVRFVWGYAIGFVLTVCCVSVSAEETAVVDGEELFDYSLEQLMNIEISVASKKNETMYEAPAVASIVPREEFELYGDRDLHQLLQRQPSVYTRHSFVFSDNLAGFRGNMSTHAEMHTLILINGRPVRETNIGYNYPLYQAFPLQSLDSVELIRGPGSVLYGTNAFTGVINLKTRDIPDQKELMISGMGGQYGFYQSTVSGGGWFGDLGLFGTFQSSGTQGYRYELTDAGGHFGQDDNHHRHYSGMLHLAYGDWTFDLFASDIRTFAMGVLPYWSNPHHELDNQRLFSNLGYRTALHERMEVELNLTYNLQEDSLAGPEPAKIGNNIEDWLGEITLYANPSDDMNIVLGYLQENRSCFPPDDDHFQSIPSYEYRPQSAYAQADYTIGDFAKLITGTQWHKSGQDEEGCVMRYGLILTPFKNWGVKLLYGEAFRAPVAMESDLYDPPILVGNDGLSPETISSYDAQLFYHTEKTYAAVTYFNSVIEDLIIYDYGVTPTSYMNGGQQKYDGIEFEYKHYFTPNWHILGSFMHQENQGDEGLNPTVVPENMFKIGTGYQWEKGSAGLFLSHFGTPPKVDGAAVNPDPEPATLLSLNIRMDVSEWMGMKKGQSVVTLKGENLLDDDVYVPTFAYIGTPNSFPYNGGRAFYAGLEISF